MITLHPDNKIEYREGDRVDVAISGNPSNIMKGTICGKVTTENIIDWWIVRFDQLLGSVYPFSCASIQHTFLRPEGDNRPFLCEGVSRI